MNTIIFRNGSPAISNLWNFLKSSYNPSVITPLVYMGAIAASEFETYAANKLYFALEMKYDIGSAGSATVCTMNFYDAGNNLVFTGSNGAAYWNSTAAAERIKPNLVQLQTIYFSRIVTAVYNVMFFNGYRLTI